MYIYRRTLSFEKKKFINLPAKVYFVCFIELCPNKIINDSSTQGEL